MISIDFFTFNPFQENTYILSDETKQCLIIDPGCYDSSEKDELVSFIENQKLTPVKLLNTHCHVDHVLGNKFIADKYKLQLELNFLEIPLLKAVSSYASQYGIYCEPSPEPFAFLNEGDKIKFGNSEFKVLLTPGHSPGSICFYNEREKFIISGDVLFQMSIGRSDLPGGDYDILIKSIREKLFVLGDEIKVYPGHGPMTTIGFEKKNNPFLSA
ncbi:MAG: MBL fold metallo-hydrolase [Bacteroidota bacterium]